MCVCGSVCVMPNVSDGRVVQQCSGKWEHDLREKQKDERKESWARKKKNWELEVMSPSQLGRNHSLQLHPAETFDMKIHARLNIWT